jgi:2-succinyl-6-hydroxy-2,4-cyclohexadiene-1-carboxylate synthase
VEGPVTLHTVVDGRASGPAVVLVHGFTQTLAVWEPVARALATDARVVRVDLPGHGGSAAERLAFADAAGAIGDAGGPAVYVGYSLGGRLCLRLALDRPDLVQGLVLVGASPGIADAAERATRRAADDALADEVERIGTAAFLDRWLAQPLFATLPTGAPGHAERFANPASGLADSLRLLGTGVQEPLWDLAREMVAAIGPVARVELVPGAGHAVPLEDPAATVALVRGVLAG